MKKQAPPNQPQANKKPPQPSSTTTTSNKPVQKSTAPVTTGAGGGNPSNPNSLVNHTAANKAFLSDLTNIVTLLNSIGGERYEGQVDDNGRRNGKGVLTWPNGNCFRGQWVAGSMNGTGVFLYGVEGDKYEGNFLDDKKHGKGMYTFANGNKYEGEFKGDKRHGKGKYTWMCGDEYDGDWYEGKMHGFGITRYSNGNKYEGSFVEDRREGKGVLTCTDGLVFDGEWINNQRHGTGSIIFPSGDKYMGDWQNDKKHGKGEDTFANGNKYTGTFKNNARNGEGTMKYANGDLYSGEWCEDKMHGRGKYTFNNGFVYDGEWKADCRHGFGVYIFPTQHRYEGEWKDDKRSGKGTLTLQNGDKYVGNWMGGKMEGEFRVTISGTEVYRGVWSNGSPAGRGTFYLPNGVFHGEWEKSEGSKKMEGTLTVPPDIHTVVHDLCCGDGHLANITTSVMELHAAAISQGRSTSEVELRSANHNLEVKLSRALESNTLLELLQEALASSKEECAKLQKATEEDMVKRARLEEVAKSEELLNIRLKDMEKALLQAQNAQRDAENNSLSVNSTLRVAQSKIAELEGLAAKLKGDQTTNTKSSARIRELEEQLDVSNTALEATEKRIADQGQQYRALLKEAEEEMGALNQQIETLTLKLRNAMTSVSELENETKSSKREAIEAQAMLTSMESQLQTLAGKEIKLKDEISSLKQSIRGPAKFDQGVQSTGTVNTPPPAPPVNSAEVEELKQRIQELEHERRQDKSTIKQMENDLAQEKKKRKKAEKIFNEDEGSTQTEILRNQLIHTKAQLEQREKELALAQQGMQSSSKSYAQLQENMKEQHKAGQRPGESLDWRIKYLQQQIEERDRIIEDSRLEVARVKQLESKLFAAENTIQTLNASVEMHGRVQSNRAAADLLRSATQNAIVQERRLHQEGLRREVSEIGNDIHGMVRQGSGSNYANDLRRRTSLENITLRTSTNKF